MTSSCRCYGAAGSALALVLALMAGCAAVADPPHRASISAQSDAGPGAPATSAPSPRPERPTEAQSVQDLRAVGARLRLAVAAMKATAER